ncbi:hypothetical protein SAMN05444392_10165 [Seinonella peptonophila]|uniref:Transporter n=1 Tax=Seinonella peptonophila TaxID=112248 RepID=A0A1M4SNJ8_9BACL|nr:AEC family transporter [Seinonella peptonophila]SHE33854.1 hypothetical protein SAMN05444392_10165 [Seinonella peptonophila]
MNSTLFSVLLQTTLPICIATFIGYLLQRFQKIDTKNLTFVSLYVLAPCLVFASLTGAESKVDILSDLVLFTFLHTVTCWLSAYIIGRLFHYSSEKQSSFTLTMLFGNVSNYGLPFLMLTYGMTGFTWGAGYVVGQMILVNTLGIYIASRAKVRVMKAFLAVFRMPIIYACIFGLIIYWLHIKLPTSIISSLKLLGNAYPAIVLFILGAQFSRLNRKMMGDVQVWIAVCSRVLLVPLLAYLSIQLLHIHGMLASILLVQAGMPAAVNTVLLTERFDGDQKWVATIVGITTLISFVTLPLLVVISQGI